MPKNRFKHFRSGMGKNHVQTARSRNENQKNRNVHSSYTLSLSCFDTFGSLTRESLKSLLFAHARIVFDFRFSVGLYGNHINWSVILTQSKVTNHFASTVRNSKRKNKHKTEETFNRMRIFALFHSSFEFIICIVCLNRFTSDCLIFLARTSSSGL